MLAFRGAEQDGGYIGLGTGDEQVLPRLGDFAHQAVALRWIKRIGADAAPGMLRHRADGVQAFSHFLGQAAPFGDIFGGPGFCASEVVAPARFAV